MPRRHPLLVSNDTAAPTPARMSSMTGGGLSLAPRGVTRTRWVGRASILAQFPAAPEWLRLLCLSAGMFGLQITWSCEMAQGASPYRLVREFA